ncbi:unnamed protein product [Urochloa humidicola]
MEDGTAVLHLFSLHQRLPHCASAPFCSVAIAEARTSADPVTVARTHVCSSNVGPGAAPLSSRSSPSAAAAAHAHGGGTRPCPHPRLRRRRSPAHAHAGSGGSGRSCPPAPVPEVPVLNAAMAALFFAAPGTKRRQRQRSTPDRGPSDRRWRAPLRPSGNGTRPWPQQLRRSTASHAAAAVMQPPPKLAHRRRGACVRRSPFAGATWRLNAGSPTAMAHPTAASGGRNRCGGGGDWRRRAPTLTAPPSSC